MEKQSNKALEIIDENGGYDMSYIFRNYDGIKTKQAFRKYLIKKIKEDTGCNGRISGNAANTIMYGNYYGILPEYW